MVPCVCAVRWTPLITQSLACSIIAPHPAFTAWQSFQCIIRDCQGSRVARMMIASSLVFHEPQERPGPCGVRSLRIWHPCKTGEYSLACSPGLCTGCSFTSAANAGMLAAFATMDEDDAMGDAKEQYLLEKLQEHFPGGQPAHDPVCPDQAAWCLLLDTGGHARWPASFCMVCCPSRGC